MPLRRVVLWILVACTFGSPAAAAVPTGFQDTRVVAIASPTALAFTPDGRLLITTQLGKLRVYEDGVLLSTPALDLAPVLCANSERGLLGVAVDPNFTVNRYIYLYYTFNKFGVCDRNTSSSPVNRVSRFTLADSNTVSRTTELVLIDNIPSPNGNHNAGDLHFGRDGFLYISVGDGGCDYLTPTNCAGANDAARDQHVLLGKILRITATGGIPTTNPFLGADSVRCNVTGRASPGQKCRETFAWGLRNPFRMAFDPNAGGTRFFINDVGQNAWEEIDEGKAGADYGWNVREGRCVNGSTTNCGPPPVGMTNPIYDYAHANGCASITGGAFVPRGVWPVDYEDTYLFSDYVCGSIFRLTRQVDGSYTRTTFASGLGSGSAVTLIFGPWGATQALYYTSYANGGEVRRIGYSSGNRAPVATASASPRSGPVPLTVQLSASGSTDPDGDPMTFEWNPGDGTTSRTGAVISHTYVTPGRYTATVTVRDTRGGSSTASVVIDAGNRPPAPSISSPASTLTYSVGQTITLTGSALDPEEGALPASRLLWEVVIHHDTHTHPYMPPTVGNNLTFQAPPPEDLAATNNSYLEIILTAADSNGASTTVNRYIQPRKVSVTVDSSPAGATLQVNGVSMTTPRTLTSWVGYVLTLSAPTQRDGAGQAWLFSSWSDGGAATHTVVTPASAARYSATFAAAATVTAAADTWVRNGAYASQNYGSATTLLVKQSDTVDNQRRAFLRFTIGAAPVGRAVLRLRGALSGAGDISVAARPVASTSWSETALTWGTQPAIGATTLATARIFSTAQSWYEWDVTNYVRTERAAGRTAVSFALVAPSATSPYAFFASREAAANRPELLVSQDAVAGTDVVLYAGDASAVTGPWRTVTDTTAAGGLRIHNPDAGAAKVVTPAAAPTGYVEFTFTADAGTPYRLWMRGRAERNDYVNDSVFVQFSNSVTSSGAATFRIGTTSATTYIREDCSGCALSGWGWQDNGYGAGVLGPPIYFATSGTQVMRLQNREDGLSIDQVVLSPRTYMTQAPGSVINDTTIVAKP